MKSPFPGMDPYLERHWRDVHTKLITYASDALNQKLPDDLIARAEEYMAIEVESGETEAAVRRRVFAPDVRLFETVEHISASPDRSGGVALAPFRLTLLEEQATSRSIQIIDVRGGERLVTVIEFISPTNKREGLKAFISKRRELVAGGVNVVEIDLVREGNWRKLVGHACPESAVSTYRAVMRVGAVPNETYLHPIFLREPLPAIKVPLRDGEIPCELPLQTLIDQVYQNGRYARTVDYTQPCEPEFDDDNAAWADEILKAAGRR